MTEKTKPEEKTIEKDEESEVVKDQIERGYYYDDACGYEIYVEDGEDEEKQKSN